MKRFIAILTALAMLFSVSVFATGATAEATAQGTYETKEEAQEITIRISVSGLTQTYGGFCITDVTLPEGFALVSYSTSNSQAITAQDYNAANGALTYMTGDLEDTIPADTYYDVVLTAPAGAEGDFEVSFNGVMATIEYGTTNVVDEEAVVATVTIAGAEEPETPVDPPVDPEEPETPVDPPVEPEEPETPVDPPVEPEEPGTGGSTTGGSTTGGSTTGGSTTGGSTTGGSTTGGSTTGGSTTGGSTTGGSTTGGSTTGGSTTGGSTTGGSTTGGSTTGGSTTGGSTTGGSTTGGSTTGGSTTGGSTTGGDTSVITPVGPSAGDATTGEETGFKYIDVDGHWCEDLIYKWTEKGVIEGVGGNKFAPDGLLTRAQAAAIFTRWLGLEEAADISCFADVKAGDWYYDYVAKCYAAGIVKGKAADQFAPNDYITRAEMFTMLCRALNIDGQTSISKVFADADQIPAWAFEYTAALINNGYVSGMTETTLAPLGNLTRAQMVKLMDNLEGLVD